MKAAVFAFTRQGILTAKRILDIYSVEETSAFAPERLSDPAFVAIPKPSKPFFGEIFSQVDAMVFVGSCGIAVREIAPHVRDKRTDPAVLCVDEQGKFVIPLLSGHIGGANDLAKALAEALDAVPVITTATDINQRFSVDSWAVKNGFIIDSMALAKEISASILEHDIPLCSMLPVETTYPNGIIGESEGELGIFIGWEIREPFRKTLRLIPRNLHLGIGCRKGITSETIRGALQKVLGDHRIDKRALLCAASIDLKTGEPGLLEFCREESLPIAFYSAEELNSVPGDFTSSEFVRQVTGIDNVCERAAMIGADTLIVRKTADNGVTIAISAEMKGVRFG